MSIQDIVYEIKTNSYYILENYLDKDICKTIVKHLKSMIMHKNDCGNGEGNDIRLPNYQKYSKIANNFLNDELIINVGSQYLGYSLLEVHKRCQGGYLKYEQNKTNCSGGSWHVDCHDKQFKALLYLTDVNENNGPFSIIQNSNKNHTNIIANDSLGKNRDTRYVLKDLELYYKKKQFKTIIGTAGTCILVDVSNIHRGSIIKEGERVTLTNYYYPQ
tara:strand:+ start:54 stop:704 length:651 start_codon:yes stop_codon:yes gene_type:complete